MKWSPESAHRAVAATALAAVALTVLAHAELPFWMQTAVSGSSMEAALYRAMDVPGLRILFPRPPAEARFELSTLLKASSSTAELYALRAHTEEQALDFTAAEQDWKSYVEQAQDKAAANFALADFYRRRNRGESEIAALEAAASLPSPASEAFLAADRQTAWKAYPRAIAVAGQQALGDDATDAIYRAWIARYPAEPAARAMHLAALLGMQRFDDAQRAIEAYKTAFPQDEIFPIKAAALLAFDEDTPDATARALALFDKAYRPLWPQDLIDTYFHLLAATHTQHAMLAQARAQLLQDPDDLRAVTRIFYYQQNSGNLDAAANTFAQYAAGKQARHAAWSADELYTFATLLGRAGRPVDAVRYDYALTGTPGRIAATTQSPEEAGLCDIVHQLLAAPESAIAIGAGNLSIYKDAATLDRGPGYLNGILSLWLNSQNPASEFHDEETKAVPYFHRAKAEELLAELDQRFPAAPARAALHAELIDAYIGYGEDAAVQQAGQRFLADFPHAPQRLTIALAVADADARSRNTNAEFAIYDALLTELSAGLKGMPLTAAGEPAKPASNTNGGPGTAQDVDAAGTPDTSSGAKTAPADLLQQTLQVAVEPPSAVATAQAYQSVLERYLGRLTAMGQQPAALALLRRELDRNPNDPRLYERLAEFLAQNNLDAQQEEVYRQAIARFHSTSFYDKLARLYLRSRRQADFHALTQRVADTFAGTDLESYFANVDRNWPQEYLQLNLYAHRRFPHELLFTRNLLAAYRAKGTADRAAYDHLLREHWQDSAELQAEFFDHLAGTLALDKERAALEALLPDATRSRQDPAAALELAQLHLWQSHFEQGAPLLATLADQYPADAAIGDEAASVFRSLAYFKPENITTATAIEKHLSAAQPSDLDRIAAIGDIYADSTASSLNLDTAKQLAQAAPFFRRIATVHPGVADGYLQSATVFWDYFQFDDALAQIAAARARFHQPALFSYEAGALYEAKRDYPRAIDEYVAACVGDTDVPNGAAVTGTDARSRLLELATRPRFADVVDRASLKAVEDTPTVDSLDLRAAVLNALHKPGSLAPLAQAAIAKTSDTDDLEDLATFAQQHQLPQAYDAALLREIALTGDPVHRIELQYRLVSAYVEQHNVAAAAAIVETVHAANSRLAGVVRSTTDFYWNNHQPQKAIATLEQAAREANTAYAHDYTLEAIAKSNQNGDYAGARALLKPLLAADPFGAQYLALQAESFSRANDAAGVRDLYLATIAALKAAPAAQFDPVARRDKIASARQAMIPALTELQDYPGALDQHIALIAAFPEDATVLQNASAYARLHALEPRLVGFLNKAVSDSPRDARFAIDLGRVDVQFEDYAGALAAYSKAIAIRGDRADLFIARADLEEHQQAFDAACTDYRRLYTLTYNDPQWMEKTALARARQGKPELAVQALQAAWIDGRPPSAAANFQVAAQLERWDLLTQADTFAAQGVQLAGGDLMATAEDSGGAVLYARLLARERKSAEAVAFLTRQLQQVNDSPSAPGVVMQQVAQKGLASVIDAEWRKRLVAARQQQAHDTFRTALLAVAGVVAGYDTPEEKVSFAALLDPLRANRPAGEVAQLWIPVAQAAGLLDREVAWRRDLLLHGGKLAAAQLGPFDTLAAERMEDTVRAQTLDEYAAQLKPANQGAALSMAARAWRDAGNTVRETADLRKLVLSQHQQEFQARLFSLYLRGNQDALLQLVGDNAVGDAAADFVLANATPSTAYKAISLRAPGRAPVWTTLNTALAGLYFDDTSTTIDGDWQTALGEASIGQRLAAKPDDKTQVVGDPWFYYGARYGLFLTLAGNPAHDPEDYLPAQLERGTGNPDVYATLAETYLDAHRPEAAIAEFRHEIELAPDDPTPDVAIAETLWASGQHGQALAEWNLALNKLRAMVDLRAVPETFWVEAAAIANDGRTLRIAPQLKPGLDLVLAAYLRKNGNYRAAELLRDAFSMLSPVDAPAAVAWTLSLVSDAQPSERLGLLNGLASTGNDWFPQDRRGPVFQQAIALAQAEEAASAQQESAASSGFDAYRQSEATRLRLDYVRWLLRMGRAADANAALEALSPNERALEPAKVLRIQAAARLSAVPALLAQYRITPETAPALDSIVSAAEDLRQAKDFAASRLLLEYVFQQRLQLQQLTAPDYLGLAEARIETADLPGALDLLHRLTLQGDFYANLDSAAALLERTGHNAEAVPFLTRLADGTPWDASFHLRLGKALLATGQRPAATAALTAIVTDPQAPYDTRAQAAIAGQGLLDAAALSNSELALLVRGRPAPAEAAQPYFVYARIAAAQTAPPAQRSALLRAALKAAPSNMVDWLRLRIFSTEIALTRFDQAQVAIAPIVTANMGPLYAAASTAQDEDAAYTQDSGTEDMDAATPVDDPYSIVKVLAEPANARTILLDLATMHTHLGDPASAINDLQAVLALDHDPPTDAALHARVDALQAEIALQQENATRRPAIHPALDQAVVVRPRLLPTPISLGPPSPPPAPTAKEFR